MVVFMQGLFYGAESVSVLVVFIIYMVFLHCLFLHCLSTSTVKVIRGLPW